MREQRKVLVGRVTSNRMDKTVVVEVRQRKRHRLYGKVINVRRRFKAHDENNACQIGDLVRLLEYRPLSREKRWMVTEILESGVGAAIHADPALQGAEKKATPQEQPQAAKSPGA